MSKNQKLSFILIGRSGSGKGTQAKLLKRHFGNLLHVVSGDLFRNLAKSKTKTGRKIKETISQGKLPLDDIATALWVNFVAYNLKEKQGLICDGFPRRVEEAKNLDNFLDFLEMKKKTCVCLINISDKEAINRLTKRKILKSGKISKRMDDNLKAIKNRMDFYKRFVIPTVDYYKKQGRLININGEQTIKNVFKDILEAIKNFQETNLNYD